MPEPDAGTNCAQCGCMDAPVWVHLAQMIYCWSCASVIMRDGTLQPKPQACPWCDSEVVMENEGNSGRWVTCEKCAAGGPVMSNEAEAIKQWNLVARVDRPPTRMAQCSGCLGKGRLVRYGRSHVEMCAVCHGTGEVPIKEGNQA